MYRKLSKILTVLLAVCLLCSVMSAGVFAEDVEITRVMATSDTEAVVMRTAGEIAFRTSTNGASVASVVWTDSSGKSLGPSDAFADDVYTLTVTLTANEGYYFSQSAVGVLYNNVADTNIAVSADGKTASLRRQIKPPIWSPIIYKHPLSDPAVEPGSLVSYVSTAGFATSSIWMFVSPEGDGPMPPNELRDKFPQITIDDAGIGRIIIYNVPAELNGWEIFCRFYESTRVYSTDSNRATINVIVPPSPTPAPTPEPTPSFAWKQVESSNEEIGTCSVCGYTESRVVADEAQQSVKGKILIGLGVATAVLMMLSLAAPARKKKKR